MTDGYQIFEWLSGVKMDEENEDHEEEQPDIYEDTIMINDTQEGVDTP